MAEPTKTRAQLRRDIARNMRMEFARRRGDSCTLTTDSATVPADTKLAQAVDFWNGSYIFIVSGAAIGEVRRISDFGASGVMTLEYGLSAAPGLVAYEIHTLFNADDIHAAINKAIEAGWRHWPDVVVDETQILQEDTLAYSLTGLASSPYVVAKLWREVADSVLRGTATAGAASTLTDTALIGALADVDTNWKLSIYAGTGANQIRNVSSVNNGTGVVTVTAVWTTNPDTTSKYALWDPTVQREHWVPIVAARFDAKEFPSTLYLVHNYFESYGLRLRLQYVAAGAALTLEASTTPIASEYISNMARAILYSDAVNDNRADRARYASLADHHLQQAERVRLAATVHVPDMTTWMEEDPQIRAYVGDQRGNPLGW